MSKMESSDEYLTTAEVAQRTRTSQSYWEKLRVAGGGPQFSKPARFVRYRWRDVAEFMDGKTRRSTSEGVQPEDGDSAFGNPDEAAQSFQEEGVRDEPALDVEASDEA